MKFINSMKLPLITAILFMVTGIICISKGDTTDGLLFIIIGELTLINANVRSNKDA